MRYAALLGIAALVAGCIVQVRGEVGPPAADVVIATPTSVSLDAVLVARDGGEQRLAWSDPVFAGDEIAFVVSAPSPVYLYLVNLSPDGDAKLVWPDQPTLVGPDGTRMPSSSWFRLTEPAGPEVAAFIATPNEIALDEVGVAYLTRLARSESARGDLMALQAALPPGFVGDGRASSGVRAIRLRADGPRVHASGRDPVVMLVDLDHRPR
jgi:uncharacterized protein DUF4384